MKHYLTLAAALALSGSAAYALNDDVNSGNTLVSATATQIGGSVNGSTINNGAGSGSASVSNSNTNSSYATSSTQNLNSLRQDSESSVTGSGNSSNSYVQHAQKRNPVATAWAAPLVAGYDCLGSRSGGIQLYGIGVSGGGTEPSDACEIVFLSNALENRGFPVAADAILCDEPRMRKALKAENGRNPCAEPVTQQAEVSADARAGSRIVSFDERLQTR